jgi:hypothetical protein
MPDHTQSLLSQLVSKMTPPVYDDVNIQRLYEVLEDIVKYNIRGIDPFLSRLLRAVVVKEEWIDIRREGRFAVVLAKNGFSPVCLEISQSGPDIKAVYDGIAIYFEITRRRAAIDEWKTKQPDALNNIKPDRAENTTSRIFGKVRQLQPDEANIVVLWSDTIGLNHLEMQEAFQYIQQEIQNTPDGYRMLSAVLFTTGGVNMSTLKQFYLYQNVKAAKPLPAAIIQRLETMTEHDLAELQKEHDELAKSIWRQIAKNKTADSMWQMETSNGTHQA